MPTSPASRFFTDSLASIWLTVMCLPTSRRKSSTLVPAVQSALSTSVAAYGPGSKSRIRSSWRLMRSTLCCNSSRVSRLRSSDSPARVADHAGGAAGERERAVTGELEATQAELPHEVPDVQRVGGGVEAHVDADRALVEPGPEELQVGRVVDRPRAFRSSIRSIPGSMMPRDRREPDDRLPCPGCPRRRCSRCGSGSVPTTSTSGRRSTPGCCAAIAETPGHRRLPRALPTRTATAGAAAGVGALDRARRTRSRLAAWYPTVSAAPRARRRVPDASPGCAEPVRPRSGR